MTTRLRSPCRRTFVLLSPRGVVVVRRRLDLARDGVDPPVDGRQRALALLFRSEPLELALEPGMQVVRVPVEVALEPALGLHERLDERPADAHRLADGLHLRPERRVGVRELLECEARDLHDDVVERRLEARRRRAGEVVRDLVERVADRELRRDLRDRVAGRLRRERRRARDARVHLDHADVSGDAVARELDVRPARVDPDRADDGDRGVAQLLVGLVGERHLRRDGHRVAGVHAHRIEVLDRADDHDVVGVVAHDLELELVPAAHRLLDQHLADRRLGEAALDLRAELLRRVGEAAAVAAERERRPDDRRQRDPDQIVARRDDARRRHSQAAAFDGRLEELAILGTLDRVDLRADQLDAELVEDARLLQLAREVERRAAAHRREQRIGTLPAQHRGHALDVERLEIRAVGEARIRHDRRRVRVDDDRAEAVLAQDLQRLGARVVELRRLADDDRAGPDQADRLQVAASRQRASTPRPSR